MKIGYIRVSRDKQTTDLQEDAMRKEECERVFTDKMSGKRFDRPELLKLLEVVREGDIIVVWKLDRLGRSLKQLIETVNTFAERGVQLKSLKENIDTSTPSGKLMFHVIGALAEFEHDIILERTHAGLDAARARGRKGGRKPVTQTMHPRDIARAKEMYVEKNYSIDEIMKRTGFKSRATFYKYIVNTEKKEGE